VWGLAGLLAPRLQVRDEVMVEVRHVALEKCQRVDGKNDAETKGSVRWILLNHGNPPSRKAPLDQKREQ
jgi:hypothetical protein